MRGNARAWVLGGVLLLAAATALLVWLRPRPAPRPSIVVILVDTLRADRLGCQGGAGDLTPRLDALAADGARFSRAYAPSSWTLPSVTSLLTGQMPSEHGVRSWITAGIPPSSPYLPEALGEAGYVTTGLMGNANLPQAGFGRGFDLYVEARTEPKLARTGIPLYPSAEDMTDLAIEALDELKDSRFFLYVHYMDPHAPYLLPRGAEDPFAGSDYEGYVVTHLDRVLPLMGRRYTRVYPYFWSKVRDDEADHRRVRELYDAKVAYVDRHVGRLLDHLDGLDLSDSTLVVVTSDHGEGLFEHGIREHEEVPYEHQVHVPLLLRGPGVEPATVEGAPVELVDLPGALTRIAGVPEGGLPVPGNGRLLAALGLTDAPGPDASVVTEVYVADRDEHLQSALDGQTKLIRAQDRTLLFDLDRDPGELENLAPGDPDQVESLTTLLETRLGPLPAPGTPSGGGEITDPELLERLRALGYVE